MLVSGCAGGKVADGEKAKPRPKLIVTPQTALVGKVKKVNEGARFVVVNFPVGKVPPAGNVMRVYRSGLRVGEVRVTTLQQADNTVADILEGQIQEGDEVRGN